MNSEFLIYGDPHGKWNPLFEAIDSSTRTVIVLGDFSDGKLDPSGADRTREAFGRLIDMGLDLRFIIGNHDASLDNQIDLLKDFDGHRIDGKIIEVGGLRIAGLGGIVREKVWRGDGEALVASEAELIARTPRNERINGGLPRKHLTTIMPWTVESLRAQKADVLITHEAPSCHEHGFEFIDQLAADMDVSLVIHGHHHKNYSDRLDSGIAVRGVGLATPWQFPKTGQITKTL
ncbi:hypothetical protein AYJ57_20560 (plasmid) [Salipiger sp. CCB-MM3]|uniref:metallophosphoesterase family protein n=1 Tax=Salipiger sp. CCB-MM3 TaxID=1792508 RepID=UPI00080AB7A7|nr:metallophosphoesterase [Salipiger sp. CCB-MM3]ANT62880.1 hypothetical protein AYJ57_20560 [Salipiger sp. CCB-MM3]